MKTVKVSSEICIGCGACVSIAPEVFKFNDEGLSETINSSVSKENLDKATEAAECCPVDAIEISE